jgi:hypothetical protein
VGSYAQALKITTNNTERKGAQRYSSASGAETTDGMDGGRRLDDMKITTRMTDCSLSLVNSGLKK